MGTSDNSVYKNVNGELFGHVELKGADITGTQLATTYGNDDKISGIVVFKGFAYDNKRLANLKWAIVDHSGTNAYTSPTYLFPATNGALQNGAAFSSGTWTGSGDLAYNATTKKVTGTYKFEVSNTADGTYLDERGHRVAWTLSVDTSYIKNVVEQDARIYVYAQDAAGGTTTITNTATAYNVADDVASVPTYQVDVLPYITGVTTRLANKNRTNKEAYSRTALGHYAIASNETAAGSVLLHGYNLKAGNADVDISSIIGNRKTGDYAYTVSGTITTINNINNNDAHGGYDLTVQGLAERTKTENMYNRKPLSTSNLTLTDDVYFDIWEFDADAAKPTSFLINDAVMKINPRNNMIGFAFANGQFNYCMPNWNTSYTNWQSSYEQYRSIGLAYDSAGYSYGVGSGGDCNAHQADLFNFMTSKFGRGTYTGKTGSTGGDRALRIESIGQMFDTSNIGVHDGPEGNNGRIDELYVDKDRIMSPSIATSRPTSGGTNIYLAYFDRINDEIRFRSGNIADPGNAGGTINKTNIGTLTDSITGNEMEPDRGNYAFGNYNDGYYSDAKSQVIAKKGSTNLLGEAGQYVSLGVVKKITNGNATNDDVVVMVWYDQYSRKLCYAYNDSPLNNRTGTNKTDWTKGTDILEEGGEYCNLVIDADNGIHIVATHEGQIKYVYLSNYLDTTRNVYTVDCDASNLTVDVAKTGTRNVPYISYYSTSQHLPKYAYLVGTAADGYDSEGLYTGAWEVTYLPVEIKTRTVPEARINVGVFKVTNTGVRTYSTTDKNAPAQNGSNIGNDDSGDGNGTCYGNGTDNPVVGYVVNNSSSSSYIEVAQLK